MKPVTRQPIAGPDAPQGAETGDLEEALLEPLYTINEVAQLTKMSAYWLREQCRGGRIAHHRLGRSYRLSQSDVLALLASTRAEPRGDTLAPTRRRRG